MRKIISAMILFLSICKADAQNNNEDYFLLDKFITDVIKTEKVYLYEKQADFVNKEKFFSKAFLSDYTHPTIGVDSKKVKKLIKELDFDYLSQQRNETTNWDFTKSKLSIIKYVENPTNQFDKIKRYKISRPIYSKDSKMAFIYYEDICGFIDCGSANVSIFKRCKGKWELYVIIPIYIS
jgi:hypothetical protein